LRKIFSTVKWKKYAKVLISSASSLILILCVPELVFDGTKGRGSTFHVLCSQTRFPRYRARRIQFSCFTLTDPFLAVPWARGLIFIFCAPEPVFGNIEDARCSFYVLRSRTHFRWYRGRRVQFSCFTLPDSFSAVPRKRVQLLCFALPDSFLAVLRVSGLVFLFCPLKPELCDTDDIGSSFHVLRSLTRFQW
jgi:hypothetical protein